MNDHFIENTPHPSLSSAFSLGDPQLPIERKRPSRCPLSHTQTHTHTFPQMQIPGPRDAIRRGGARIDQTIHPHGHHSKANVTLHIRRKRKASNLMPIICFADLVIWVTSLLSIDLGLISGRPKDLEHEELSGGNF
jgi:hypothetical protein